MMLAHTALGRIAGDGRPDAGKRPPVRKRRAATKGFGTSFAYDGADTPALRTFRSPSRARRWRWSALKAARPRPPASSPLLGRHWQRWRPIWDVPDRPSCADGEYVRVPEQPPVHALHPENARRWARPDATPREQVMAALQAAQCQDISTSCRRRRYAARHEGNHPLRRRTAAHRTGAGDFGRTRPSWCAGRGHRIRRSRERGADPEGLAALDEGGARSL